MQFLKAAFLAATLLSGAEAAVRIFNFTLSEGFAAPDGFIRTYTFVNGTSPGPEIRIDQGDEVIVNVTNTAAENATIHFHGIEMFKTPWNDGVPGVSQRPIMQGESYVYRWTATQYGAYWYHSHYRGQIEDGLYGAIIIQPRPDVPKPFSVIAPSEVPALVAAERVRKALIVSDVTHLHSHEKHNATVTALTEVSCYDSIVFNGKGKVNCLSLAERDAAITEQQKGLLDIIHGAELTDKACIPPEVIDAAFDRKGQPQLMPDGIFQGCEATTGRREFVTVPSDTWVAIDVIGANNFILAVFSIDEHDMWVYAVDGEYINPQKVQAFKLFNGDRVSVLVKTKRTTSGAFRMRTNAATAAQMLTGHAVLSINQGTNPTPDPESRSWINITGDAINEATNVTFLNHALATQFNARKGDIPKRADAFHRLEMNVNASWQWALAHKRLDPMSIDTANLPDIFAANFTSTEPNIIHTKNNTWVDLLFYTLGGTPMPPHPIHKHGVKMYHLGSGHGPFRWGSVNEAIDAEPGLFNLENPPKVDAVMTPEAEFNTTTKRFNPVWSAARYHVTDPGSWAIHCHIHNHVEGGMLALIQDGTDVWPKIPQEYWDYLNRRV